MSRLPQLQAAVQGDDARLALETADKLLRDPRLSVEERAEVLRLRSIVHERLRDLPAALADLERARLLKPRDARLANETGLLLSDLGEGERALAAFRAAVSADPKHFRALGNLGNALKERGDLPGAIEAFRSSIAVKHDYVLGWTNLGVTLRMAGQREEARRAIEQALALDPRHKIALLALGALRRAEQALDAAVDAFAAAVRLDPADTSAWLQLAGTLAERNDIDAARQAYGEALARDPAMLRALFGRELTLPLVYPTAALQGLMRARFDEGLRVVEAEALPRAAALPPSRALEELRWVNWLLPYQGEDEREHMARYASVVGGVLEARAPQWRAPLARAERGGRRLRVGFISGFFRDGTVGRYFQHWITDLDRTRFEVVVYHVSAGFDALAQRLAGRADLLRHCPTWPLARIAEQVRSDAPDAIVYPEVGLDPTAFALAALRLAPLQCAAWGHPVTTGHATIDAYFSSAAMEPEDAQAHYVERLVLLPGIGTRYARPAATDDGTRAQYGLPEGVTLFLCPQTQYKIHPDNDALYASVLAANPQARLALFEGQHPRMTATYRARFEAALRARDVDPARLVFLPIVGHADYMRINALCDVMLDTLHWSGGNTSLDAIAAALPIVTLPGRFMRGRQSYGMLKLMGLGELVARDADDYVRIATRLAAEPAWRDAVSARIRERQGRVFDDARGIEVFAKFLLANG